MARGGNAVDAACAAALAAAAAESALTGPGAGGFLLARSPDGAVTLLDLFVAVPGLGPCGRGLDPRELDSFTVPFGAAEQVFHIGPASVAVPGMIAGLVAAGERLGRLSLSDLVAPAAAIARTGAPVGPQTEYLHGILHDMLTFTPEAAAIFEPAGRPIRAGERLQNHDLAATLELVGREGADVMRVGELAGALVDHLSATGGLVTREDLTSYRVEVRTPVEAELRGVTVVTNAPPSTGGSLIGAALAELNARDAAGSAAEQVRAVVAAGAEANRRRDARSSAELRSPDAPGLLGVGKAGAPLGRRPTGTTHVSAVDADGGSASLSSSNGSGSGVVVPGTGFLLNNMLGEQDINPDGFGALAAGERMSSMMAPTLLLRDGEPAIAIGSAGSNRLRSAILQTVAWIVDGGLGLKDAVDRPRAHPEGDQLDVEPGVPEEALERLESEGWLLRRWTEKNLFFGGVAAAGPDRAGLGAAGDARRGGAAAGVTHAGQVVEL